ncbi:L-lysine 6-monooxygenase (NADPH) [Catenulispora acidiphila DSM 44928]|uniref:L-lysine N6-monooxygenase MbtG n=1 Tax=Catenulispora acidiphila (strain DSM 44928 / JCM 14897 / NBRC 102108 / NRRL B-24433 / ID139908) TaxID=479433 RepID=C7QD21_CATAD|nr:SidA/IucD/PvdA family monooxygenase [Catenulispora acidiphila]ACU70731.1 L-lysine 6-monooxygenase (NADPH) [Catenulispora acidiphila DSM 44928]
MQHYDVVGVGIGPFNLSLAALAEPLRENHSLQPLFLERQPVFAWHRGMMLDGATLQVPFLADLVSLTDPTSRFSVLNWLRETDRLYSFYFAENLFLQRREYEAYCQWVAAQLPFCRFGTAVTKIRRSEAGFEIEYTAPSGPVLVSAANIVLGIGTEPVMPFEVPGAPPHAALHSADYMVHRERLRTLDDVTVIGSGQSGAEIVLDLLRSGAPGQRVRWLTRSAAFEPMEYSKLGLEHFTPDYTRFFHGLREDVRADLLRGQGRLHKAISFETIAELHAELHMRSFDSLYGGTLGLAGDTGATLLPGVSVTGGAWRPGGPGAVELTCLHERQKREFGVLTDAVVLATGYRERVPGFLDADLEQLLGAADLDHRIAPGVYAQNAERHTHGVGAPDLGLGAHRAAVILNALTGRTVYDLPRRAAHTAFDPEAAAERDPGIRIEVP